MSSSNSGRLKLERGGNPDKHLTGATTYSETFYPRPADESESESLPTDEDGNNSRVTTPTPTVSSSSPEVTTNETDKPTTTHYTEVDENPTESATGDNVTCGVCFQILLDPISLGCGHSFCEICLAGMWKASRFQQMLCPMCRDPWGKQGDRVPSVNVTMRWAGPK